MLQTILPRKETITSELANFPELKTEPFYRPYTEREIGDNVNSRVHDSLASKPCFEATLRSYYAPRDIHPEKPGSLHNPIIIQVDFWAPVPGAVNGETTYFAQVQPNIGVRKAAYIPLKPTDELLILSDLHGLTYFLDSIEEKHNFFINESVKLIITGDNIDRGSLSLETLIKLLEFKKAFPDRVVLCFGNHELDFTEIGDVPAEDMIKYLAAKKTVSEINEIAPSRKHAYPLDPEQPNKRIRSERQKAIEDSTEECSESSDTPGISKPESPEENSCKSQIQQLSILREELMVHVLEEIERKYPKIRQESDQNTLLKQLVEKTIYFKKKLSNNAFSLPRLKETFNIADPFCERSICRYVLHLTKVFKKIFKDNMVFAARVEYTRSNGIVDHLLAVHASPGLDGNPLVNVNNSMRERLGPYDSLMRERLFSLDRAIKNANRNTLCGNTFLARGHDYPTQNPVAATITCRAIGLSRRLASHTIQTNPFGHFFKIEPKSLKISVKSDQLNVTEEEVFCDPKYNVVIGECLRTLGFFGTPQPSAPKTTPSAIRQAPANNKQYIAQEGMTCWELS